MDVFLNDAMNDEPSLLYDRVLYRETITEIFSPRGIGKSLFALFLAVRLALKGFESYCLTGTILGALCGSAYALGARMQI